MRPRKLFFLILGTLIISALAAGCTQEGPCEVTGNQSLTIYRLPDPASDVFGTLPSGQTHEVLAYTTSGFVGFDPGIAQAGNTGLAHHRWILLNASLSPFCLANVDLVTLPDVLADMPEIDPTLPPPPPPDPPAGAANMVITQVNLATTILTENAFALVEVIVENQGDAPATGYDVVLFPQYGNGPQNPGGQDAVPDLAPGDSHTITFTPGIIYGSPGTYTLRVLLTDDWYSTGGPDSTGTAGDFKDIPIKVILDRCNPFEGMDISMVLLNLPPDTWNLPVYLKVSEEFFPGFDPEKLNGDPISEYNAKLGKTQAHLVSQQGFPKRLYFMFIIPEGTEGTAQLFELRLNDCPDPVYTQPNVLIPVPKPVDPVCSADLNEGDCKAAGGDYKAISRTGKYECVCP